MDTLDIIIYEKTEKILNTISHALAAVLVVIGWYFLFSNSNSLFLKIGVTVYCISIFVMFFNSSLYHGVTGSKFSYVMRAVDHSSIFLAIAGTYTPLLLFGLTRTLSTISMSVIWVFALTGIVIKIVAFAKKKVKKVEKLSIMMYLGMGWISLFVIPLLIRSLGWSIITWIFVGGLFYTIGVLFYKNKKLKLNHFIWHLFIIFGSMAHYVAVYLSLLKVV